uniref:ATP synthase F0 subunit 8 n=1 Tax=Tagiades japetus TaxID=1377267 RepID=UPI0025520BD4|nr:ATP synthase F0 subunit 8 [Tagiades japetus]WGM81159.1 ATP synthase F0 subunit 8 [Tagiades japetus]
MPQMMPINWIISFILFIIIFLLYNILNYYIFNTSLKKNIKEKTNSTILFNWKW